MRSEFIFSIRVIVSPVVNTIDYCNQNNIPAFLISVDFEKAFDMINWHALDLILTKYNFGPRMKQMIQICYQDIESTVINNGFSSDWFRLSRGTCQGDPLSSLIFNLVVEVLGQLIRPSSNLTNGIPTCRKLHAQYVDDIWVAIHSLGAIIDGIDSHL